jgi:hypothetical protein
MSTLVLPPELLTLTYGQEAESQLGQYWEQRFTELTTLATTTPHGRYHKLLFMPHPTQFYESLFWAHHYVDSTLTVHRSCMARRRIPAGVLFHIHPQSLLNTTNPNPYLLDRVTEAPLFTNPTTNKPNCVFFCRSGKYYMLTIAAIEKNQLLFCAYHCLPWLHTYGPDLHPSSSRVVEKYIHSWSGWPTDWQLQATFTTFHGQFSPYFPTTDCPSKRESQAPLLRNFMAACPLDVRGIIIDYLRFTGDQIAIDSSVDDLFVNIQWCLSADAKSGPMRLSSGLTQAGVLCTFTDVSPARALTWMRMVVNPLDSPWPVIDISYMKLYLFETMFDSKCTWTVDQKMQMLRAIHYRYTSHLNGECAAFSCITEITKAMLLFTSPWGNDNACLKHQTMISFMRRNMGYYQDDRSPEQLGLLGYISTRYGHPRHPEP